MQLLKMEEKRPSYIDSAGITDFGYFRVSKNLFGLRTYPDLMAYSGSAGFWGRLKELTESKCGDIPLEIDLPARPVSEVNLEGVSLSIAELAGAAAFIKFITKRESLLFGHTYLGRFAKRWFNVLEFPEAPKSDRDNWIREARGERGFEKIDQIPSLVYLGSQDLFKHYAVVVENEVKVGSSLRLRFGNIDMEFGEGPAEVRKAGEISRESLHSLIGFCRAFSSYSFNNYEKVPGLVLVESPLLPFAETSGKIGVLDLLKIDKIQSFI